MLEPQSASFLIVWHIQLSTIDNNLTLNEQGLIYKWNFYQFCVHALRFCAVSNGCLHQFQPIYTWTIYSLANSLRNELEKYLKKEKSVQQLSQYIQVLSLK